MRGQCRLRALDGDLDAAKAELKAPRANGLEATRDCAAEAEGDGLAGVTGGAVAGITSRQPDQRGWNVTYPPEPSWR
jgi:hypothetical protein